MSLRDPYPWWVFDNSPIPDPHGFGEAAVRFIRANRHHSNGKPYHLDPWQERIVRRIFGDTLPDGSRRIKHVAMLVSRGARKTGLAAVLALMMTVQNGFRVPNGQVILAAHDRDQARVAFEEAQGLVASHRAINAAVRVRDNYSDITHRKSKARLRAVSSDAASQNGRTPVFVVFDEVHCWKRRDLYDVLRTGLRKTSNTLSITISQAGRGQEGIAHDIFEYARKVATGEVVNEAWLPILFENPTDADPFDEATWRRANPGLSCTPPYPPLEEFHAAALEASGRPTMLAKFKNDQLGIWLETNDAPWLNMAMWDAGAGELVPLEDRRGQECWIGVDLGRVDDMAAVVVAFRDPDGGISVYPFAYVPEAAVKARRDPYQKWVDAGLLTATPGDATSFPMIEEKVRELHRTFDVAEVCFDPWSASHMMQRLSGEGIPVYSHRQGFVSMAEPMRTFERTVLDRRLRHGGNPLFRWNVGNVVADMDPAGNTKPNKAKSAGKTNNKIDVAVAAVMAVGRAEFGNSGKSPYADGKKELMVM